jgi:hypothetical protein
MYQDIYYVPKQTGTLTDALLAYGVAVMLEELLRAGHKARRHSRVHIEDTGSHYILRLPEPIQEEWLEQRSLPLDMACAIKRKKVLPEGIPMIDYNLIWEEIRRQNALRAAQRATRTSSGHQAMQDLQESLQEQPYRDVALLIGDYRMQVEGIHNQAVTQWYESVQAGYQVANLRAILQMFATPWSDPDVAMGEWAAHVKLKSIKRQLTVSQVFNPSMGKGQNRAKMDKLLMENFNSFWLLEYLKAVGLFAAAAPRAFTDENMRKTYVLAPLNISLTEHEEIFKQYFEPSFYGLGASPIKADILASLKYARAYLSYCLEARSEGRETPDLNPRKSIKGFYVATYVLLSKNSYTMINLSFLGLPPWLHRIETVEDVVAVQGVIDEHEKLIRPLEEQFQEGSELLSAYRDFLTGNRIDAFFDFCAGYGEYVVHTLLTNSRIKQHSVASLDEIFRRITMTERNEEPLDQEPNSKNDLTEFSFSSGEHPGFHRIAYAIRWSTTIPQRQSANYKSGPPREKPLYSVRYGLGHNLRRKANSADEFMEALTEFVHDYNAETDQIYENTSDERKQDLHNYARKHYRRRVRISDLDDVLVLVKEHGPNLVCKMLVAYGYTAVGDSDGTKTGDGDEIYSDDTKEEREGTH